ncbi:MAG: WecB/TagA/CpsF family glycosyltransferase [Chloroflexi bacterium]|nr:WecB/TagA/CpsF family glycosyltransferase [Chloroflexota bacterium]
MENEDDKIMRKLVVILGAPIDDLSISETLERLESFIEIGRATNKNHQVATVNVDFLVKAISDPELSFLLQDIDLAMADGMPLVWGARLLGVPFKERVAGSDVIPLFAERAAEKGYSIYLLGAAPGVAAEAANVLTKRFPDLRIVGTYSPPYRSVLEMDPDIIDDVQAKKPDILLVAFGNPKQEKWIGMHRHELNVPVMIGVGATLDFIAGYRKRAPVWMQRAGLEWVFRLLQEPKRLWRRYVVDLFSFGFLFLRQWWLMRRGMNLKSRLFNKEWFVVGETAVLPINGRVTIENHETLYAHGLEALTHSKYLIVNMKESVFLDSSAIGTLVGLAKEARNRKGNIWIANVPDSIYRTLNILRLEKFFRTASDMDGALKAVQAYQQKKRHVMVVNTMTSYAAANINDHRWTIVKMPRRFDASTADEVSEQCESNLLQNPYMVLDFSDTVFLASAGLAVIAKLHRLAESENGQLCAENCSQNVLKVIETVRFDQFLSIR